MPYLGMTHVPILQSLACVASAFFRRDFHIAAVWLKIIIKLFGVFMLSKF